MLAIILLAASLAGIGTWLRYRHVHAIVAATTSPGSMAFDLEAPPPPAVAEALVDAARIESANARAAERLWKLAFAAPSQSLVSDAVHTRIRHNIESMLEVDTLDPNYFPRRPALMPQLLQAVNDPSAAAERISRIIAHDPVLAVDVLRLANSSVHRKSATPIDTIQRAIVVCGVEALRGMLAAAMLRPVFRATRKNFPRLPRMLWERTERAARAAEMYAMETHREDRFEAQLAVLLSALGPLVVYSATLDVYARNPHFQPSASLCVDLIGTLAPRLSVRVARDWQTPPRLLAALENAPGETLTTALHVGELLGTLSFLESQTVIAREERCELIDAAGLSGESTDRIWAALTAKA
jgi:HD-like signal output (HDOD) protein